MAARQMARRRVSKALRVGKTVSAATARPAATAGINEAEHARMVELINARQARAKIPEEVGYQPKWQLELDMIDEIIGWGNRPPVLVADAGYCPAGSASPSPSEGWPTCSPPAPP